MPAAATDVKLHTLTATVESRKSLNMKTLEVFSIFLILSLNFQNNSEKYEYNASHFQESIELLENREFIWKCNRHILGLVTIKGTYQIFGDSLVLNSSPQRDKIIVRAKNTGKFENKVFKVPDKQGNLMTFHLYVTLNDNSEKVFKDCYEKIKFKSGPIKSFHIINTGGLKSPEYKLNGSFTNFFEVQLENIRVFDNENWYLIDNKIQPKGFDGENQNYYLTKK